MNTFKLKNSKEQIQVPKGLGVITSDSTDDLVNTFLNQDGGKFKQARIDRFFSKIPTVKTKKSPEKVVDKPSTPEAPKSFGQTRKHKAVKKTRKTKK